MATTQAEYVCIDAIAQELMCPMCHMPLVDPHSLPCGHTFCLHCLRKWRKTNTKTPVTTNIECPICKDQFPWTGVKRSSKPLCALVDNLMVYCPNRRHGCCHQMPRSEVDNHVSRYCDAAIEECTFDGCTYQCRRRDLAKHMEGCTNRKVSCLGCGKVLRASLLDQHTSSCPASLRCPHCEKTHTDHSNLVSHLIDCEKRMVACPHSEYGCRSQCLEREMEGHLKQCPFEAIQGFLRKVTENTERQEQEIAALRAAWEQERKARASMENRFAQASLLLGLRDDEGLLGGGVHGKRVVTTPQGWSDTSGKEVDADTVGDVVQKLGRPGFSPGTLVEFQWFVQKLQKPRGSLISPNFNFADLEWQLSIDGADNGIYLAANGRGVRASYMISVVEGDLSQTQRRSWVSMGSEEFGVSKWGCPGIMYCFYKKDIVVTVAFTHVISPINIVSADNNWVVGVDSHHGTASLPASASTQDIEPQSVDTLNPLLN